MIYRYQNKSIRIRRKIRYRAAMRYKMSFTTGGLLHLEAVELARVYLHSSDWKKTREEALAANLLRARTKASSVRLIRATVFRLQALPEPAIRLLPGTSPTVQCQLLWVAACRQFTFIGEFATEVLREKHLRFESTVTYDDFDAFFDRKADWHEELESLNETTRRKNRQVLFRMMRQADITSEHQKILTTLLANDVRQVLSAEDLDFFPALLPTVQGKTA